MADALWAIVLGMVQGATEFLPVSSSGHLLILYHLRGVPMEALAMTAFLHLGTFLAVLMFVRREVGELFKALKGCFSPISSFKEDKWFRVLIYTVVSTFVTIVLALPFESKLEGIFEDLSWMVGVFYVFTAILLLISDRLRGTMKVESLGFLKAILIGCFQALAVLPGVSRSGSTIFAGIMVGLQRDEALKYSFILSLPVTLGAGLLSLKEVVATPVFPVVSGFVTSLFVGLLALKVLKMVVRLRRLSVFAFYCLFLGIGILFWR